MYTFRSSVASRLALGSGLVLLSLVASCGTCDKCVTGNAGQFSIVGKPSDTTKASFEKLKTLAGTWQMENPEKKGEWNDAITFSVTSGGNVVREIMFAGAPHEMTNTYHLDGDSIVVTHYCAVGNQPTMRAGAANQFGNQNGNTMHFTFDHVSNYSGSDQTVMCDLTLTLNSADVINENWKSCVEGKLTDQHNVGIELRRKK